MSIRLRRYRSNVNLHEQLQKMKHCLIFYVTIVLCLIIL